MTVIKSLYQGKKDEGGFKHRVHRAKRNRKKRGNVFGFGDKTLAYIKKKQQIIEQNFKQHHEE